MSEGSSPGHGFWLGRDVMVTGHTGFKGSWLCLWLSVLGARVHGLALPAAMGPEGEKPLFEQAGIKGILATHVEADLRDSGAVAKLWGESGASALFHLAAQPLVRESYRSPSETFEVNALGTVTVLEALRQEGRPCGAVFVTTDKVYENLEEVWGRRETDRLGGHDLYSASKAAAELAVAAYRSSFFGPGASSGKCPRVATARAGNVIGGGDWAAERLVPDLARAFLAKRVAKIRQPKAVRPWQHVLEPLGGYLRLARKLLLAISDDTVWSSAWNFGPEPREIWPVEALANCFASAWGEGATWEDASSQGASVPSSSITGDSPLSGSSAGDFFETGFLSLSIDKAGRVLGWCPRWGTTEAVARAATWYRGSWVPGFDAKKACLSDISAYMSATTVKP